MNEVTNPENMPDLEQLQEFQKSLEKMQSQMQGLQGSLENVRICGKSVDGTVRIYVNGTGSFEDIEMDEAALKGGFKEFKWRMRQAMKDVSRQVRERTQQSVMDITKDMNLPTDND